MLCTEQFHSVEFSSWNMVVLKVLDNGIFQILDFQIRDVQLVLC
jgi:hypothetical protein